MSIPLAFLIGPEDVAEMNNKISYSIFHQLNKINRFHRLCNRCVEENHCMSIK